MLQQIVLKSYQTVYFIKKNICNKLSKNNKINKLKIAQSSLNPIIYIQNQELQFSNTNNISKTVIIIYNMIQKSSLPVFHFLFTELIEETYTNYKQANYLQQLKRIGTQIGYRIFTHISIKKQINQRPSSIQILMKNIQTKVFKYLFNYQAANFYTAAIESESEQSPKEYYQVIEDNISIYLTWMPENLWDVSSFIAGIIESICLSSGLQCEVTASPEHSNNNTQSVLTKYLIKYSDIEAKKWNQKQ